ncbi:MAG TPA: trehalose-6-phosphate synthase [Rhizomicrobium sp.]|nr:trehalose-6-phosphate synthase [Rhizomicrobium sp.]
MARLVVVSNRVPVPGQGQRAGGLAVVLQDVMDSVGLWFGWSGNTKAHTGTVHSAHHDGVEYATIDLTDDEYQKFYVGFANSALWPLLHFRLGLMEFRREDLEGYRAVNRLYGEALAKLLRPDDLIWIHDYHLIPLGGILRRMGLRNRIGFYLHIPFVPHSVFSALPQGDSLLRDLCEYDVAGFQTEEHRSDFLDTVRQSLGHEISDDGVIQVPGRPVQSLVAPVGIDALAFQRQAERASKSKNNQRMTDSLAGRHLMIGVDRLDYSKGLPNRFEAFNRLLTRFPEHKQQVSFLQVAVPSREDVSEYASLRPVLSRMAGDINGRHGTFDWVPLRYMSQGFARGTLAGFDRLARVGVVTPLRDGMNLVAHEYIAAQNPEDPGVLVLSRFAGAASYFQDALIVNPNDPDEIAEAMHAALVMPLKERRVRYIRLFENVLRLTAASYCETFLDALSGGQWKKVRE